jgi:hypothetical protein
VENLRSRLGRDLYWSMQAKFAEVPDELWERVKPWIPYWQRSPRGGPRRLDDRRVFAEAARSAWVAGAGCKAGRPMAPPSQYTICGTSPAVGGTMMVRQEVPGQRGV